MSEPDDARSRPQHPPLSQPPQPSQPSQLAQPSQPSPPPPLPPLSPLPNRVPGVSRGLVVAVCALLGVAAVTDLLAVVAGAKSYALINDEQRVFATSQHDLEAADNLYGAAGGSQMVAYVACAVLFITWFFRTRRGIGLLAPDRFRKKQGWAIAAWFVPIGNFWLPYGVALDMWRATAPLPVDGERVRRTSAWPVTLWWALFVGTSIVNRFASSSYGEAESLPEFRNALTEYMVADSVSVAAAAAAVYFVVRLTARQREKSEQPGVYGGGPGLRTGAHGADVR